MAARADLCRPCSNVPFTIIEEYIPTTPASKPHIVTAARGHFASKPHIVTAARGYFAGMHPECAVQLEYRQGREAVCGTVQHAQRCLARCDMRSSVEMVPKMF